MAASSLNAVRVRLYFDYPPPAVSDCRMCWVLVDLNKCRVVADLASVIREKFDFSRRTILNLFIEDCYLPPTESVYVVRDNDSIRVKVENQPPVNGIEASSKPEGLSQKANKRTREAEEENEGLRVKKKKKKAPTEGQEVDPQPVVAAAEEKKKKKKRKKLKEKNLPVKPAAAAAAAPVKRTTPVRQPAVSKPAADKAAKKPATPAAAAAASRAAKPKAAPSSSETSDSSEEEPPKKAVPVTAPGRPGGAVTGAAKAGVAASSSWESSSDSSPGPKPAAKPVAKTTAPPTPAATAVRAKPRSSSSSSGSDSDSTSRTRLANRRPGLGHQVPPLATGPGGGAVTGRGGANPRGAGRGSSPGAGRGVGRGDGRFPWRGGSPRGGQRGGHGRASRGAGNHVFYCHGDQNGPQQQQPQRHADDTLTNKAVVLQNPPESAPQPRRDYGSMPLLAAPPRVGQKIAFKLLELTENYTPEVSDYKEGKIIGIDQGTNQIELELLSSAPGPAGPGKFDLVYQNADGSEIVEYAVSRTSQLTERWDSLLEPRLILENNV